MCAAYSSSLLLFTLTTLTISIMCGTKMATEGLPLERRQHGADEDILAGADFLSVFMESSLRQAYRETTTPPPPIFTTWPTTTINPNLIDGGEEEVDASTYPYVRTSRSTNLEPNLNKQYTNLYQTTYSAKLQDNTEDNTSIDSSNNNINSNNEVKTSDNLNDGVIVAVRVSSSVGRTLINKPIQPVFDQDDSSTTLYPDQNFVASEEHPSIVAEASKSEFSVDESEPITRNSDLDASEFSRGYPATVQALPRQSNLQFNANNPNFAERDDASKQPYHQTVIYHSNPRDPARARSVSYSTVIQSVPHTEKNWVTERISHGRHERHYENTQPQNNFSDDSNSKRKINDTATKLYQVQGSVAETNNYFVTTKPLLQKNWEKPEENFEEHTTKKSTITTERNWELPEKIYQPQTIQQLPKVYGRPEQNYEVDEAVSVVTNGRSHGIQPSQQPPQKQDTKDSKLKDDNQKVGYVVEGRNYRKYRVEERTADGFIVGEYGVVSHDDGSLRGVRYTADGTISPRLIYDALMKFLSL